MALGSLGRLSARGSLAPFSDVATCSAMLVAPR